jgi:nucleotide-binding universal stress UspA family protein
MALPKKIIVATDYSETADRASELAIEYAERFGAALHWVHSFEHVSHITPPSAEPLITSYVEQARHAGRDQLRAWVARAHKQGIDAELHDVEAPVAASIVACAREVGADGIIIGAHGHTTLGGVLLGSVTERVVRDAECSVLVVRGPMSPLGDRPIVLGDELSTHGRAARGSAVELAKALGVGIDAMHGINLGIPYFATLEVLLPKELFDDVYADIYAQLEEYAGETPEVTIANHVSSERPADGLCRHAKEVRAGLVVVGSRSLHGADRVLLGSVAERVVRRAPCSVLVVR